MGITKTDLKNLTYQINGAAIEVHKSLGPGLLESVYHQCLAQELDLRGIQFVSEVQVPVDYKGLQIDTKLRCDLLVENMIILELKAVDKVQPIDEAKLLTYMKLLSIPKGIIYNFHVANLYHEGQKTYVNGIFSELED